MSGNLFNGFLQMNPKMKNIFGKAVTVMAVFLLGVIAAHVSGC